jgi:hypothetical protein
MTFLELSILGLVVAYLLAGSVVAAGGHFHPGKRSGVAAAAWAALLWLPVLISERLFGSE